MNEGTAAHIFETIGEDGHVIHRVQSQEECDRIFEDQQYLFDQEACTCFSQVQCRIECPEGMQLDPTR